MRDFVFQNPTKILFGKGKIAKLGEEVKRYASKVLLVYGRGSIKKNGVYDEVVTSLKNAGVDFVELPGVKPNPVLSKVKEGIEISRKENVEAIVAVGGGSTIDTSKTIAAGFYYDGDIWDAFVGKYKVEKSLPIFVVLTISATGSEMNGGAVITNEETKQKFSFWTNTSYPKVSILDPSVQFSLPPIQTLNGAADAISHVLELYFDGTPNTLILDEISEGIIRTIISSTEILIGSPRDYDARANLVWSATLALNGINGTGRNGGDWSSHAIEHSLSALYDIAHGSGLAVVFPAWMKYVYKEDVPKFARFARKVFNVSTPDDEEAALEGIEELKEWYRSIGLPVTLKEANIPQDEIEEIVKNASMRTPFGKLKRLYPDDVREILKLCL
jgi:alcohol dehydrogenase YqhD (iron-dependent ADH family)